MISAPVILVIGPPWWAKGFDPHLPKSIEEGLPKWWTRRGKDLPRPATLMEAEGTRRTEEMDTKFFTGLIEKRTNGSGLFRLTRPN